MNNTELPEKLLKSLKLFSYYVKSHGCKEAECSVYFSSGGDHDLGGHSWNCKGDWHSNIETYESIDSVIEYIIENSDYVDNLEDYDNSGSIDFEIDTTENILSVEVFENVTTERPMGTDFSGDELNEDVLELFSELERLKVRSGRIDFNGSGDSGDIEDRMSLDNGRRSIQYPTSLQDWLYTKLGEFYGGWEINEGSYGGFIFDTKSKSVILDFNELGESNESRGRLYTIKF